MQKAKKTLDKVAADEQSCSDVVYVLRMRENTRQS